MITDLYACVQNEPPDFHSDELCVYRNWASEIFFLEEDEHLKSVNVDISKVIGHDQIYGVMTWQYMLHNLKRIESRLQDLADTPGYYTDDAVKDDWSFIEVEDQLFIDDGKHRTTILRYLAYYNPSEFPDGAIARNVELTRRHIDYQTMDLVCSVKKKLKPYEHMKIEYIGDPYRGHKWQLLNLSQDNGQILFRDQLAELDHDLTTTNFIKRLIGKGYHASLRR